MQFYRIAALLRRYLFFSTLEILRIVDILYWPIFDIVLWGFTGVWIQNVSSQSGAPLILLTGLVFWQVVMRSMMEISMSFIEELWSQNLINLFATPLKISEWVVSVLLLSTIKSIFSLLFGASIVWLIYGISIFSSGLPLIPLFCLLLVSGWSLGFISVSILVTAGQRAQTLLWIICWLFAPFSGVFYPVAVLPWWAQKISSVLPTTYVFEGMRAMLAHRPLSANHWYWGVGLAVCYALLSLALFVILFHRSKTRGLARLQLD
jgi:ABC-2 type transport system permease protein